MQSEVVLWQSCTCNEFIGSTECLWPRVLNNCLEGWGPMAPSCEVLRALDLIQKPTYALQSEQEQSRCIQWTTHIALAWNRRQEGGIGPCVKSDPWQSVVFSSKKTPSWVLLVGSTLLSFALLMSTTYFWILLPGQWVIWSVIFKSPKERCLKVEN